MTATAEKTNEKSNHRMAKKEKSRTADDGKSAVHALIEQNGVAQNDAAADREAVRRRLDHAAGRRSDAGHFGHSHRQPVARRGPRRPGHSPRPHHRDLWPRIERQDDAGPARRGPGPKGRRHRGLHRRRARLRSDLGQKARRAARNAARQPAEQRRRGDADHRDAGQEQRGRCDHHRLGRGPRAAGRSSKAKSAIRTSACRPA